jgi:hypothetical protein
MRLSHALTAAGARAFEPAAAAFARLKIAFYSNRDVSDFIQIRLEQ